MSLRDEFPNLKIVSRPDGFLIKCSCYEARHSGIRRVTKFVDSIPDIRAWVESHEHIMTRQEAMDAVHSAAQQRRAELDEMLARIGQKVDKERES